MHQHSDQDMKLVKYSESFLVVQTSYSAHKGLFLPLISQFAIPFLEFHINRIYQMYSDVWFFPLNTKSVKITHIVPCSSQLLIHLQWQLVLHCVVILKCLSILKLIYTSGLLPAVHYSEKSSYGYFYMCPFVLISTCLVGLFHLNSILMKSILYNISVQTAIKLNNLW